VVLALAAADAAHPAFSIFLPDKIVREQQAILCNRRSGAAGHASLWMFHLFVPSDSFPGDISYETDRMRSLAEEIRLSIRRRCLMSRRCRAAMVPYLIRLSLSDAG